MCQSSSPKCVDTFELIRVFVYDLEEPIAQRGWGCRRPRPHVLIIRAKPATNTPSKKRDMLQKSWVGTDTAIERLLLGEGPVT